MVVGLILIISLVAVCVSGKIYIIRVASIGMLRIMYIVNMKSMVIGIKKGSKDCMRYLWGLGLVVVLLICVRFTGRADEVFTVKTANGREVVLPVPEGYKQLSPELLKKYAKNERELAILVPVEDYVEYLEGVDPSFNRVIYIDGNDYSYYSRNSFEEIKQAANSEKLTAATQQRFQRGLGEIPGVDTNRSRAEVKIVRDISRSANSLVIRDVYFDDGMHLIDLVFGDHISLNDIVLNIHYHTNDKTEDEAGRFYFAFIDKVIALNPEEGGGQSGTGKDGSIVANFREQEEAASVGGVGSDEAEVEEKTKTFYSTDFGGVLPFAVSFRYPEDWSDFELSNDRLTSKIGNDVLYERLKLDSFVIPSLKIVMECGDERIKEGVVATVVNSAFEKEDYPNCTTSFEKIGRYYTGINTFDYNKIIVNRETYYKARRFYVVSGEGVLVLVVILADVDSPENRRRVEARLEELSMEVKEVIKTLNIGAEAVEQQVDSSKKEAGAANTASSSFSRLNKRQYSADYIDEVFTVECAEGGELRLPVPEGYWRLNMKIVKKINPDIHASEMLALDEKSSRFMDGLPDYASGQIVINIGVCGDIGAVRKAIAEAKEAIPSEFGLKFIKQFYLSRLVMVPDIDNDRTTVEVQILPETEWGISELITTEVYCHDGSHVVCYAIENHLAVGEVAFDLSYFSQFASKEEACAFNNELIAKIIELNKMAGDGMGAIGE